MRIVVSSLAAAALIALGAGQAAAQTGVISGRVTDVTTLAPIGAASITLDGTTIGVLSQANGAFVISNVPAGVYQVRASLIGYATQVQEVTVPAGGTATVEFTLNAQAVDLEEIVVTGYGTQRRVAITGSIGTVQADEANVGVTTNVNDLIQGRISGVNITVNDGEPGAGANIRIRGATSISASNTPLYVVDGVPVYNVASEAGGIGTGGTASLARSPAVALNPSDIESIAVLKDAAAAAIYGSRAANGVVLITTKSGRSGEGLSMEYDGYVASSTPAGYLDLLTGSEYRSFVQDQIAQGNLSASRLDGLGQANTDWERELTQRAVTQNHNLAFTGGTLSTRYRASLNYMNQEGIVRSNGFERISARLNGSHSAWDDRLRLDVNLGTSHVNNDYLQFENTGGFEGGVFQNMAIFNPTYPVTVRDPETGKDNFYEIGTGRLSVRNPVAIADQISDEAGTTRTIGNVKGSIELADGVTGQMTFGIDRFSSTRRTYLPASGPIGAEWNGRARQVARENTSVTFQGLAIAERDFAGHNVEVTGGYEFVENQLSEFGAEARNFLTDLFTFNNLSGGADLVRPFSWQEDSRLVSFFGRVNYNWSDKYFLTGVLRYDGSSRFGAGNKWALFPALSASWRLTEEAFMDNLPFSEFRLRVGYGIQGNEAVPAYASLITLETQDGARYVFGETPVVGVAPTRNANPDLKWEETSQFNVAIDYGLSDNRISGTLEYYEKNTEDLLLTVAVAQPAVVSERLENIGSTRNRGVEASLDALLINTADVDFTAGLVFSAERNEVVDLGGRTFITSGFVSGQGQSGQVSQRIMPGSPLGTFFGPEFVGHNAAGEQLFNQYSVTRDENGVVTSRELIGTTTAPGGDDFVVIGDANPAFRVGVRGQLSWGNLDASTLIRADVGQDVFNNTSLVYATKGNALQDKNFIRSAIDDGTAINQPAIFSSRWIEDGSFVRLQNLTVGYTFDMPELGRTARAYVSGDNLLLLTGYSGYDPEVNTETGLASYGIDYLSYPRARTFTFGLRVAF